MSKKILIIDDEKEIVQIMKKRIKAAGYEVETAYNGQEGLEISHNEHPHLILTDVMMPVMDGLSFYHELRRSEDISHIPVIVATAYGTTEEAFRNLGAKDFLLKPFDIQTVLARVGRYFDKQKAFKVLIATKMVYLMKSILNELPHVAQKLDISLTNNPESLVNDACQAKPDLIILDVGLCLNPSAEATVAGLRREQDLKETTILLVKNMLADGKTESDKTIEECLNKGASHFAGSLNRLSFESIIEEYCR